MSSSEGMTPPILCMSPYGHGCPARGCCAETGRGWPQGLGSERRGSDRWLCVITHYLSRRAFFFFFFLIIIIFLSAYRGVFMTSIVLLVFIIYL